MDLWMDRRTLSWRCFVAPKNATFRFTLAKASRLSLLYMQPMFQLINLVFSHIIRRPCDCRSSPHLRKWKYCFHHSHHKSTNFLIGKKSDKPQHLPSIDDIQAIERFHGYILSPYRLCLYFHKEHLKKKDTKKLEEARILQSKLKSHGMGEK